MGQSWLGLTNGIAGLVALLMAGHAGAQQWCGPFNSAAQRYAPEHPIAAKLRNAKTSFSAACDKHHQCYGTRNMPQSLCDLTLQNDLNARCGREFNSNAADYSACLKWASAFYQSVNSNGGMAYRHAQDGLPKTQREIDEQRRRENEQRLSLEKRREADWKQRAERDLRASKSPIAPAPPRRDAAAPKSAVPQQRAPETPKRIEPPKRTESPKRTEPPKRVEPQRKEAPKRAEQQRRDADSRKPAEPKRRDSDSKRR